jgi:peptidoglycan hydrolase CwlO-like protein
MELINKKLQDNNLTLDQLSSELQDDIKELQTMVDKFNEAVDEYESGEEKDEATEKKLDDYEDHILATEKAIAEKIGAADVKSADGGEVKTEDKGNSLAWVIFGGLALVATFGVVNVLKKR